MKHFNPFKTKSPKIAVEEEPEMVGSEGKGKNGEN